MKKILAPIFAAFVLLASCTKEKLVGSGPIVTEDRTVSGFTRVTTSGSTNVYIEKGASFSVQVKGYGNLLPHFETAVRNNTLEVGYKNVTSLRNDNLEVFVTMPALDGARSNGSADMVVKGDFTSNNMQFSIEGSGNIDFESGTTQRLFTSITGSGQIRLFGLTATEAETTISGSGTTEISVVDHLKATINGSGNIYYKGTPTVESSVSGSGRLLHRP
jgi:hypothetical protein